MTARAIRVPPTTEQFGLIWIGASNEIANSATNANGTIPTNRGKGNRNLNNPQADVAYCGRLVSASLGWVPSAVEHLWGAGRLWDGNPPAGPFMAPALPFVTDLADLGIPSIGVIVNAEGGKGISDYAAVPGTPLTWFNSRVGDSPLPFRVRGLIMRMGLPDMQNSAKANAIAANLTTIVNYYRNAASSPAGAKAFHAFKFAPHPYFGPGGGDPQPFFDVSVDQHEIWEASDPRNHLIHSDIPTRQLDGQTVVVSAPAFGPHWGPENTANSGGIAARALFNVLASAA